MEDILDNYYQKIVDKQSNPIKIYVGQRNIIRESTVLYIIMRDGTSLIKGLNDGSCHPNGDISNSDVEEGVVKLEFLSRLGCYGGKVVLHFNKQVTYKNRKSKVIKLSSTDISDLEVFNKVERCGTSVADALTCSSNPYTSFLQNMLVGTCLAKPDNSSFELGTKSRMF